MLFPMSPPIVRKTGFEIISQLGLATNLELLLDAGDANSYSGSDTHWRDVSGNDVDFFLGTTSGADTTDPTFSGTAGGKSAREYFGFDGGDRFVLDGANPAWINAFHKDSAACGGICAVFLETGTSMTLFSTNAASSGIGFRWSVGANGTQNIVVGNGSGLALSQTGVGTATDGAWNILAFSLDEAANATLWNMNEEASSDNATYSSPSANDASGTLTIGATTSGGSPLLSGCRIGMFGLFSAAPTATQLAALVSNVGRRFQ